MVTSVLGNAIEWFDFAVYGLLSGIIAHLFFPSDIPAATMMLGFGTVAVSFIVRPIGGVIFGIYADRHGRKNALTLVFGLMALGTLMIGLLPTYAAIGLAAPVVLIISRMIQGFSAGGEFGNATAALIEFAPPERRGLYGSLQLFSQSLAILSGAMVVMFLSKSLDDASFQAWGWRVPFLLGAVVGPLGLYMRMRVTESPEFLAELARFPARDPAPVQTLWQDHKLEVFASVGIFAALTAPNYVNTVYFPSVAVHEYGMTQAQASQTVLIFASLLAVVIPLAGWLSDLFDRITLMSFGLVSSAICYALLFTKFVENPSFLGLVLLQSCFALPYGLVVGPAATLAVEFFPVRARATGASLSYNLAAMLFGGMAPIFVSWMATGTKYAPAIFTVIVLALGLAGVMALGIKKRDRVVTLRAA